MKHEGFTPGPWTVKRTGCISDKAGDQLVATTGYRVAADSDEDDANARLIAAAPDLLAENERLRELLVKAERYMSAAGALMPGNDSVVLGEIRAAFAGGKEEK